MKNQETIINSLLLLSLLQAKSALALNPAQSEKYLKADYTRHSLGMKASQPMFTAEQSLPSPSHPHDSAPWLTFTPRKGQQLAYQKKEAESQAALEGFVELSAGRLETDYIAPSVNLAFGLKQHFHESRLSVALKVGAYYDLEIDEASGFVDLGLGYQATEGFALGLGISLWNKGILRKLDEIRQDNEEEESAPPQESASHDDGEKPSSKDFNLYIEAIYRTPWQPFGNTFDAFIDARIFPEDRGSEYDNVIRAGVRFGL